MTAETDGPLMDRLRAGDDSAIGEVHQRYGGELKVFCHRMVYDGGLAEDIVQEVLLRCCRTEAGQMPSGSLRGWLYRVARNRCIDELRKMHPAQRLSAIQSGRTRGPGVVVVDPGTTPARQAARNDRTAQIQMVVDGMEDDLRSVVVMHFFQGLSNPEIAEALDLSVSGAKARLVRAMKILKERLAALNDTSG